VVTFSRERGLMAARLSAATRSHRHSPRDKLGARSLPAGDGLARRLQRAVRRSRDRASGDGQLAGAVSDKSPPGTARSRQRRVIPTRSTGALMVTAPRRSQRLGPPDGRALPPATHPGLSFGARPHRGRRRQRAAVGTRPEAPRRAATCSRDPDGRLRTRASWLPRSCARSSIAPLACAWPR
jgi:hypothetical protein